MPPTFHLFLPQMRMPLDDIVARALAAEAAGFEGIAFMDHLTPPLASGQDMWEAMTVATWVLARTSRLQVGHLVLCDWFRHPAVLARQIATLDHASGGRIELGIGWGSIPEELAAFGLGAPSAPARVERLDESLTLLRRWWSGEPIAHEGAHFSVADAQQRPVPTRRIPVTVGGVGPRTLDVVRRHADWWNLPVHHLEKLDALRPQIGEAKVSMQCMVALVPSEAERDEIVSVAQRRFGGTAMGRNLVVGTVPELTDHFGALHARGVDRFYVWLADFAPPSTLQGFGAVIAASS